MEMLPGSLERMGDTIIVHCHFSLGWIVSKEDRTKKENKKILKNQLFDMLDDVRTGLIHYDFGIDLTQEVIPIPCTKPNKNEKVPINLYEEEEELIAEMYFGNSIFIPSGDVEDGKQQVLQSIKEQVMLVYEYLKVDEYVWEEKE